MNDVVLKQGLALMLAFVMTLCGARVSANTQTSVVHWNAILKQSSTWYSTSEALRIADNVLLYQRQSGGWPKNIDMAASLSEGETANLVSQKSAKDSTIDNGSTYTQLAFLARVYTQQSQARHRDAFIKGLDYLFEAQYANGGWPQFYPDRSGYYRHITFNDGAMIGVMKLLRDVANKKADYLFVNEARRMKAATALQKAIECILKTQIIIGGRRTVWCAQYDEDTLKPAAARKYELVSLSGLESVDIVRFLMSIPTPNATIIESIEGAVAWFQKSKLNGIRWIGKGNDRVVVNDPNAPLLWARFYQIETNRPIFVGRDGVIKYTVAEIDHERRNGYAWYVEEPAKLLDRDYPQWRKKHGRY